MYTQTEIAAHKANGQFECCQSKSDECFKSCQYLNTWMKAQTNLPEEPAWFYPIIARITCENGFTCGKPR
jgi:hypothetical protein